MACSSDADLERAMFSDGLSTADAVTETSGRGVGLAAVAAAVDELGGRIEVASRPGHGTSFTFVFESRSVGQRSRGITTPSTLLASIVPQGTPV
jgi:K+-sensing histidine kinase KdpD